MSQHDQLCSFEMIGKYPRPRTTIRLLSFYWLACLLAFQAVCASAQGWMYDQNIKGLVIPIYLPSEAKPAAIFRARQIFPDYQRRGFFRIGALPLLVIDGFSLELRDPLKVSSVLNGVQSHIIFKERISSAIEGRDFSLSLATQKEFLLIARVVRLESSDAWRLQNGLIKRPGTNRIDFRRATLWTSGSKAGELTCETTNGLLQLNLLSCVPKSQPQVPP